MHWIFAVVASALIIILVATSFVFGTPRQATTGVHAQDAGPTPTR